MWDAADIKDFSYWAGLLAIFFFNFTQIISILMDSAHSRFKGNNLRCEMPFQVYDLSALVLSMLDMSDMTEGFGIMEA